MSETVITDSPKEASSYILDGKVVAFPTETVYGLGASALDQDACQKIYSLKGRPGDNPLILHVCDWEMASRYASIPEKYENSMVSLTPGPITFILEKKNDLLFSAGLSTVGIRIPRHRQALDLIRASGVPIAAPSANRSGEPSITRMEDLKSEWLGKVDCILTGDDPEIGLESTVVDLTDSVPRILRPGYFSVEDLSVYFPGIVYAEELVARAKSPGTKYRHYSPNAAVYLVEELPGNPSERIARIGFEMANPAKTDKVLGSNLEYMKELFAFFRKCDREGIANIYCQLPRAGQGEAALLNRIQKAATSI